MRTCNLFLFAGLLWCVTAHAGAPPVTDLRDVSALRDWFQRQSGSVRLIALLSPSCTSCLEGFAAVQQVLKDVSSPKIAAAVVWMSIRPGEKRTSAVSLSSEFIDGRIAYFWDPYRAAGETWQSVLKLNGVAWDVYLVYGPGAIWNEPDLDPAPPAYWMHQLKQVPQAPVLNRQLLEQHVVGLLPKP